jgi:hypothetical protein
MSKKKKPAEELPRVHKDLKGFKIEVDALGQISMNRSMEEMSRFLKEHLSEEEGRTTDGGRTTDDRRPATEE